MTVGLSFAKWEGLGNDFVLVSALEAPPAEPAALARALCDRRRGVGADGLILLTREGAGLGMEILNSDGSLAAMCGNGIRCLAAYARREGHAVGPEVDFATRAGPRTCRILSDSPWRVEVDMGAPEFLEHPAEVAGFPAVAVSMGNPHRVLFVPRASEAPLATLGPQLEREWPGGANVEFVEVRGPGHLVVAVWERGSGATMACGTGACAALAAAAASGRSERRARVDLPGGPLDVRWEPDGRIRMVGPAREVFRGTWNPDPENGGPP